MNREYVSERHADRPADHHGRHRRRGRRRPAQRAGAAPTGHGTAHRAGQEPGHGPCPGPARPLGDDEITRKFLDNTSERLPHAQAMAARELALNLGDLEETGRLVRALEPPVSHTATQ